MVWTRELFDHRPVWMRVKVEKKRLRMDGKKKKGCKQKTAPSAQPMNLIPAQSRIKQRVSYQEDDIRLQSSCQLCPPRFQVIPMIPMGVVKFIGRSFSIYSSLSGHLATPYGAHFRADSYNGWWLVSRKRCVCIKILWLIFSTTILVAPPFLTRALSWTHSFSCWGTARNFSIVHWEGQTDPSLLESDSPSLKTGPDLCREDA